MNEARTQAILLLTARLGKSSSARPLSIGEYNRLALWLHQEGKTPEDLLTAPLERALAGWLDPKVTKERLQALLDRGTALAIEQEKWARGGIWIITRSDKHIFPARFRERLKHNFPPLLFGCGQSALLNQGGLAVVGSRKAMEEDLRYSWELGKRAAQEKVPIISGAAKGVDETAMRGALENGGQAVGVVAKELLRTALSKVYRAHLQAERLVLVSPFHPEAGFNVGNAMQRNKYIYALSDAAVVVHSGPSGGTWSGAEENLKNQWVPLFIKETADPRAGNNALIRKGGKKLSGAIAEVKVQSLLSATTPGKEYDLFSPPPAEAKEPDPSSPGVEEEEVVAGIGSYEQFLERLRPFCNGKRITQPELAKELGISRPQLKQWLQQALQEGVVKKKTGPVRYEWSE